MGRVRVRIKIKDTPLVKLAMNRQELQPLPEELLAAGHRQRSRIIKRTARGLDWQEKPFAPYSTKGPYYYYPAHHSRGERSRTRATARILRKVQKSRYGKDARATRSGLGIRFENYAAFKRSFGRSNVDLMGMQAPHMMQSIVVRVQGSTIIIGIYDRKKAKIASGHNIGIPGRLPRRHFFDVSDKDKREIKKDITDQLIARMEGRKHGDRTRL